jgi:outer membrane lipoprotein-sorting protein
VIGEETLRDVKCWIVELNAKSEDITYQIRKIWVDEEKYVPLREDLYAKSGKLLKKTELYDFKRVQGRWFPGKMVFKDMLKKGDGTEFVIESIEFDTEIPEYIFTKASLR